MFYLLKSVFQRFLKPFSVFNARPKSTFVVNLSKNNA